MTTAPAPLSRKPLGCKLGKHVWGWALVASVSSRGDFDVIEACTTCGAPGRAWRAHVKA